MVARRHYFKPVKTGLHLLELKEAISDVFFDNFESTQDRKGNPMYRLNKGTAQTGLIVVMNKNLLINVVTILEEELKWNQANS